MNVDQLSDTDKERLTLPDFIVDTPCFIILEDEVRHNLQETVRSSGGINRLVPHVKTHRSPWLTRYLVQEGVKAFKAATPREVEMILNAGASEVIWAYPTMNKSAILRVVKAAANFPNATLVGLVDSQAGFDVWRSILTKDTGFNIKLRVDLDPGMGRTGIEMSSDAVELAVSVHEADRFDGWHIYDGHVQDVDINRRTQRFNEILNKFNTIAEQASLRGCTKDLIAGGSYTFSLWAARSDARVSPGSWIFSSSQHQTELGDLNWRIAAYVLTTVLSERNGTITLDAGSKAISPDMPMERRFAGIDKIMGIKEEHSIVIAPQYKRGEQIAIVPRHACTTAYLYRNALVRTNDGKWEVREQLGCER